MNFLKLILRIWKKIAHTIGRINTLIILSIFYFVVLAPVAIVKKIIKPLKRKRKKDSYWTKKEPAVANPKKAKFQF